MSAAREAGKTFGALRRDAVLRLREAGIENPEADARLLLCHAAGFDAAKLIAFENDEANVAAIGAFEHLLARRISGEPVARMTGRKEFWSLSFALNADTLVPRPETETLVEAALAEFPEREAKLRVLDLGTGTGALLAAILSERPHAVGVAVDRSEHALRIARDNLDRLGLANRAQFICGDWTAALGTRFDLIVSNPPYIAADEVALLSPEVRDHDPRLALDGGADGLDAYRSIVNRLPAHLTAGGVAVLELGQSQEPAVTDIVRRTGSIEVRTPARKDLSGIPRALVIHAKR